MGIDTIKIQYKQLWASTIPLLHPFRGGEGNLSSNISTWLEHPPALNIHVLHNGNQIWGDVVLLNHGLP